MSGSHVKELETSRCKRRQIGWRREWGRRSTMGLWEDRRGGAGDCVEERTGFLASAEGGKGEGGSEVGGGGAVAGGGRSERGHYLKQEQPGSKVGQSRLLRRGATTPRPLSHGPRGSFGPHPFYVSTPHPSCRVLT